MGLVLYYAPMSSATRVHWALEELGIPFDKVKVDLSSGEQRKPEFLKLNPNGKVPTLIVDGTPMFESCAMLIHLGETFGVERKLYPPPGAQRIEALKWMVWGVVTLLETTMRFARNSSERWPAEQRNQAQADAARKDLAQLLKILDEHLSGREYILEAGFSLADCSLATLFPFMARIGVDLTPFTNVNAWVARCMSRPALARATAG